MPEYKPMRTIPGTLMSGEPYTLTEAQIDALNSLPPGLYAVCSRCRRFSPAATTLTFDGDGLICEPCVKGVPHA